MPDGRVFVGGGGLCGNCGVNHLDAEMYSPHYLFNEDGTPAARPTVSLGVTAAGARPPALTPLWPPNYATTCSAYEQLVRNHPK